MAVTSIDADQTFWDIVNREFSDREKRLNAPVVKLWDGNWILRGRVSYAYSAEFVEMDSETGSGKIEMPEEYYLSQWVTDHDSRQYKNIHITVEKDGVRWSGRMDHYEINVTQKGKTTVILYFKHEYEEFKHILVWCNPFLPAEIQFPRLWIMFGQAKWALKTTLFCQILRLEASLWMLPDDPLDPAQWFNLDQSTWSMVVKPDSGVDNSPFAIVLSRFKTFHDTAQGILEDAQLTPTFRRYLDGDDPPWEGADLRHGCLVIDIEDKSGWQSTGTSWGGSIFTGLIHSLTTISSDGLTEGVDIIDDPAWPDEYSTPGWKGTLPQAPGVVFRQGDNTGIRTSKFIGTPAKDVQHVAGGHSMPGVNELISAAIQMAGDLIAMIIGVPPVGGAVDAILRPLYTDVFLAFMAWKDVGRAQSLGFSHYRERMAEGADRAYTLSAIISLRTSLWATREQFTHQLTVEDGCPWRVGANGKGHFYLGDRIGSTVKGTPKGKIYIDRVSQIGLVWDRDTAPTWNITIGERKIEDPVVKAFKRIQAILSAIRDLGVL